MILFLTNADTEILSLRSIAEAMPVGFPPLRAANPTKTTLGEAPAGGASAEGRDGDPAHLERIISEVGRAQLVVVRLLGGTSAWEEGMDLLVEAARDSSVPLVALGGEATPDPEMLAASSVPTSVLAEASEYFAQGGLANLENCLRMLSDSLCGTRFGSAPPRPVAQVGILERHGAGQGGPDQAGPLVGVVFYRAHVISGNVGFIESLCDEIEKAGARAVAVWCYSLRPSAPGGDVEAVSVLAGLGVDAVVTTVWASGSTVEDGQGWDASALASLGVPIVQAVAATGSRSAWEASMAGLSPIDVAMSVAIPEFDGRIDGPVFSFKEVVDDGAGLGSEITAYRAHPDQTRSVASLAVRLGGLGRKPAASRRIAVVLSAYPTKRSRLGNAVGLDTPESVVALLRAMAQAGYRVDRVPSGGDALMAELADKLTYDVPQPSAQQAEGALARISPEQYRSWFAGLDPDAARGIEERWGPAPGEIGRWEGDLVISGIDLGGVVVAIQPPRGFGEDPIADYHSPDLPPTHHYLAFYRWLDLAWGADAMVHVGKHGTLEWLPGKSTALGASCYPQAVLGSMPLVYPFVVNDPGEGTQAKRRTHAVVVDHLVPPLTRAESYGGIAKLESLLDTHAQAAAMDPAKLPAIRAQVWDALVQERIESDLGIESAPEFTDDSFDDMVLDVDGYLCELKDAQIRGGLHVLGSAPQGEALVDMVLALTRIDQGRIPSLRRTRAQRLGIDLDKASRAEVDAVEGACRDAVSGLARAGWRYGGDDPTLGWICDRLVPALAGTEGEVAAVLDALDGRHVPSGPSGAPSRGAAHVLPTGRNFYSIDPQAVPSRLAWDVGVALAAEVCASYRAKEGRWPASVGLVCWGTAAMRTGGDDVAEALALMGVRPVWSETTGRVSGLELMSLEELGRPRVDVTLRISGFFRDAFAHVIGLLDDAVALAAAADEPPEVNFVRAGGQGARIFGPKPGAYGSGVLGVLESGKWENPGDLGDVWLAWSGWSYGRGGMGMPDRPGLEDRMARIEVAVKNQDNREHDVFDSDDYLQDHGGMVAAAATLAGRAPLALFGDSADPARPAVRTLAQEAARVVRSRVVNPKWLEAMRRHGYKGAFEMAATVDYLYGYDATTGVVEEWMYERVTEAYVADPEMVAFFGRSSPWALSAIAERLLEAADRGMWKPSDKAMAALRAALLQGEAWEESR